jgi:hypothetical protein
MKKSQRLMSLLLAVLLCLSLLPVGALADDQETEESAEPVTVEVVERETDPADEEPAAEPETESVEQEAAPAPEEQSNDAEPAEEQPEAELEAEPQDDPQDEEEPIVVEVVEEEQVETLAAADGDEAETVTYVAAVGEDSYETLAEAVEKAEDGQTVKLLANVDISETGLTITKEVTIDLAGFQIKAANTVAGRITVTGSLTLKDSTDAAKDGTGTGRLYSESDYSSAAGYGIIGVSGGGKFTLESGYIYTVRPNAASKGQFGVTVDDENDGNLITINGGKIEAGWYTIAGNGTHTTGDPQIVVNGGTLVSTADYAIYLPHSGTTIVNGGVIDGAAGAIAMNRGTLIINDGTLKSAGNGNDLQWGDGTSGFADAAINVQSRYGDCTVTINGGNVAASKNAVAVEVKNNHTVSIQIKGGTFNQSVQAYLADGYKQTEGENGTYVVTSASAKIAEVNGEKYETLAEAVAAANGGTVALLQDVTESITIPAGANITLDLNGKTLTNTEGKDTIDNSGTLAITGPGTIDNVSNGKSAIFNQVGGEATVGEVTVTRSKEDGVSGSNTCYTINNRGTMYINGATVDNAGTFSSCVENGWYTPKENTNKVSAQLTINSGTFSGGLNTIKNDDWGVLIIKDGAFTNSRVDSSSHVVLNYGTATISGGTFTLTNDKDASCQVIYNKFGTASNTATLTITGGVFKATTATGYNTLGVLVNNYSKKSTVTLSGGQFYGKELTTSDYIVLGTDAYWAYDGESTVVTDTEPTNYTAKNVTTSRYYLGTNGGNLAIREISLANGDMSFILRVNADQDISIGVRNRSVTIATENGAKYTGKITVNDSEPAMVGYEIDTTTSDDNTKTIYTAKATKNSAYFESKDESEEVTYYGNLKDVNETIAALDTTSSITFYVRKDLSVSKTQQLTGKGSYTLDLNGAALTVDSDFEKALITAQTADQTITIQDTSEKKTGKLDLSASTSTSAILLKITKAATVNLTSGTVSGPITVSAGELNITGGSYTGTITATGGTINISGGTHTVTWSVDTNATVNITGGTFDQSMKAYLGEGYVEHANDDGTYTVYKEDDTQVGATVNGVLYPTLQDAIDAAQNGGTVILASDVTATDTITISKNDTVTIDLADYTLTLEGDDGIVNSGDLTLQGNANGKIRHTGDTDIIWQKADGTLTITGGTYETVQGTDGAIYSSGGDVTLRGNTTITGNNAAIYVTQGATLTIEADESKAAPTISAAIYGVCVWGKGDPDQRTTLKMSAGTITATEGLAISGNGSCDYTTIDISGGTIESKGDTAIYHPQVGDMTITGDTTITGVHCGIQFCGAGTLTLGTTESARYIPTITATMDSVEGPTKPDSQSDGSVDDGAALSIISRGKGYQDEDQTMTVIINNAELVSKNNAAISVYRFAKVNDKWQSNGDSGIETSYLTSLTIKNGSFSGASDKGALEVDAQAKDAVSITGGTFSSDPSDYVSTDDGYSVTEWFGKFKVDANVIGGGVEGGGVTEDNSKKETVELYSKTLTLEGDIAVNYYLQPSDYIVKNYQNYYVEFTVNGRTIQVPLDVTNTRTVTYDDNTFTLYRFTCKVTSAEMNDTITAKFCKRGEEEDTLIATLADYSVVTYAKHAQTQHDEGNAEYTDKLIDLVNAMLNYGGKAQAFFGHEGEGYANADLTYNVSEAVETARGEEFAKHSRTIAGEVTGLTYYSSTLVLDSETAVRFYFTLKDGAAIEDYSFTVNGEAIDTATQIGYNKTKGMYYVEIPNIKANALNKDYTLSVAKADGTDGTLSVTYGPMTYASNTLKNADASEGLKSLVKALYYYYYATVAFVAANAQ